MNTISQLQFLRSYFDSTRVTGSLAEFILDAGILIIISLLLTFIYQKFGNSLSNRKKFSANFILLSLITMMIISVIRSSLALSLGLVGALSIIRFRSAIKEPEELAYIFLSISLGLAFGAQQREIGIVFFILISAVIVARALLSKKFSFLNLRTEQTMYLDLEAKKKLQLEKIESILDQFCHFIELKRFDNQKGKSQALFVVKLNSLKEVVSLEEELEKLDSQMMFSLLNDEGLF